MLLLTVKILIILSSFLSITASEASRLSKNVVPVNYKIDLILEDEFPETKVFYGRVTISLDIREDLPSFPLHIKNIEINDIKLEDGDEEITISHTTEEENDFLIIIGQNNITSGSYILTITYTGYLSNTSMKGFYLSSYDDADGNKKYLTTTQFEQMDARRAFPCFDEPAMKATFDISITTPDGYNTIRSNAEQDMTKSSSSKTTFKTTPLMSTYLIAFLVSQFDCLSEICYRPEASETAQLALEVSPKLLDLMEEYTQFVYDDMQINKLTQVAIPDFPFGGMENLGLVTYPESYFLWDEKQSPNSNKQKIVTNIAHEFAHLWFGDLVTLEWWSDIYLNEGFATYFEYHITDLLLPDWQLQKQFLTEEMRVALVVDSTNTALPLSYNSTDPNEIKNRFDDISYNKGGSIIRMIKYILGDDNFKKAVEEYVALYKFNTSTTKKLLATFENFSEQTLPFQDLISNWIKESGYPLLTVSINGDNVIISQKQFLLSGEGSTKWYVPITYSTKSEDFINTTPMEWLTPDQDLEIVGVLKNQKWFVLNNQQIGYYRVMYDDTLLQKILENIVDIDEISTSQLIDDQFNLARAKLIDYGKVLENIKFLKTENSYYPWYSAFEGFSFMLQRTSNETLQIALKKYIADLMTSLNKSTSIDQLDIEDHMYTLKQVMAQTWACRIGTREDSCVKTVLDLFDKYKTKDESIDPNLRSIVYCHDLRYSNNSESDFDFLWRKYLDTKFSTERITILNALGCIPHALVQINYLAKIRSSEIRIQDIKHVISSVTSSGRNGVTNVFLMLITEYNELKDYLGDDTTVIPNAIQTAADFITTDDQLKLLVEFSKLDEIDVSHRNLATSAIKTVKANLEFIENLEEDLKCFFKLQNL